jgi:hypothetical protein
MHFFDWVNLIAAVATATIIAVVLALALYAPTADLARSELAVILRALAHRPPLGAGDLRPATLSQALQSRLLNLQGSSSLVPSPPVTDSAEPL